MVATNIHWINYLIFICEIIRCIIVIDLQFSLIISVLNKDMFQIIFIVKKLLQYEKI